MAARKALFSKPAWAAKSSSPVEVDQPIFQQNVYEDILQERRRKEAKKALKQKEKEEKAAGQIRKSESRETKADEERTVKKQRISNSVEPVDLGDDGEEDDDLEKRGSESDSNSNLEDETTTRKTRTQKSPVRDSRRAGSKTKEAPNTKKPDSTHDPPSRSSSRTISGAIPVDDDDDDEIIITDIVPTPKKVSPASIRPIARTKARPPPPPPPPESESESEEEDEYIRELKRKARQEARDKNRQAISTNANAPILSNSLRSPSVEESSATNNLNNPPSEPTVHLLIHTIIPECPAIAITRRPSQTLESVLAYFCEHHKLNEHLRAKIFFTWNNQRLFKSTTTRSILDQIKRKHPHSESNGKITLEAVTQEIYEHRLKQKEESRRRAEAAAEEGDGDGEAGGDFNPLVNGDRNTPGLDGSSTAGGIPITTGGAQPAGAIAGKPPKSPGLVIKLTPEDPSTLNQMSLRVHANTTIEKIVRGYKSRTGVEPGRDIYLVFEGDRLEGPSTVLDVGFEDGDSVDVRCR